jgi:hypothetical protein
VLLDRPKASLSLLHREQGRAAEDEALGRRARESAGPET